MYSTKLKPNEKIEIELAGQTVTIRSQKIGGRQVKVLIDSSQKVIIKKLDDSKLREENFNSEEGSNSWPYQNR